MEILFVTTSIPFPARQGVELPLKHFIEKLSSSHIVDLLVITADDSSRADYGSRRQNVPKAVRNINMLSAHSQSSIYAAFKEILGLAPTFLLDRFDSIELRRVLTNRYYDVVWFSPIGCIGLLPVCQGLGLKLANNFAVGNNDAITTLYWDGFKPVMKGRVAMEPWRFLKAIRTPWIWLYERRYLKDVNLIHVQTELEKVRMKRILGKGSANTRIVDAPNGKNKGLSPVKYHGRDTNRVLFMTHLTGGRGGEARWFLKNIWPRILKSVPQAQLIIVGRPPKNESIFKRRLPPNVKICGYVNELSSVFESVAISVIPTAHGTGWVNRVADSLTAGVPIVGCTEPLRTIPGLQIGIHALKGDTVEEFANNVIHLLKDLNLRDTFSKNAKMFSEMLPTWEDTTGKLEQELEYLTKKSREVD